MPDTIRERTEQWEKEMLSPKAAFASETRGRLHEEARCPVRTDYQRDRDRIIHSKAFRRLKHKTQVFIDPEEDHYRTRLTHTLEVAQISRTIARGLRLNEDLVEAIALGHDLGHTPFGHAGESALDEIYKEFAPEAHFKYSEQSLRVVDLLEKGGRGLNLTWEVRDGILHHSKGRADLSINAKGPATLEGKIVRISDRVAYINHDIDDAIRAGLIKLDDLPEEAVSVVGRNHAQRIGAMVIDIIEYSRDRDTIGMSEPFRKATDHLKDFLFAEVYGRDYRGISELRLAAVVLKDLFKYYMERPEEIREMLDYDLQVDQESGDSIDNNVRLRARTVCDLIAGMTDRYAQRTYQQHFLKWLQ